MRRKGLVRDGHFPTALQEFRLLKLRESLPEL